MGITSHLGFHWGRSTSAFLFLLSSIALAGVKYPPQLPSAAEQQQYILRLMQEYPWLASTGISGHLPGYVRLEQTWIGNLYQMPQFQQLNATRPDLLTIKVQSVKREKRNTKVLALEKIELFRQGVIDVVQSLWPSESQDPLKEAIEQKLQRLTHSDPQKILVGLISLLPQTTRAGYFKVGFTDQLEMLRREAYLSDQIIEEQFQFDLHNLASLPKNKRAILDSVEAIIKEENALITLLRAKFSISLIGRDTDLEEVLENDDVKRAVKIVQNAPSENFDVASENDNGAVERFLKSLSHGWPDADKEDRGLAAKYLERVFKAMKNEERVVEAREVPVAQDLFTIQEIIPELGVYRGVLGGDCSTTHSFAFPFSPLERVFLIFDNNGEPMRLYFSGTILQANRKPAFYLHDIAGPALTRQLQGIVLHALWQTREQFGAELITLPTLTVRNANAGEEPSQSPRLTELIQDLDRYIGETVKHKYLDGDVRQFLGALPNSGYDYDSPEFNIEGHLFVPQKGVLEGIRVIVVGKENQKKPEIDDEPLRPKEAFLRLLDLLAGEEKPEMFFDELGIDRVETERILALVNNANRLSVKDYYAAMRAEFAKHDIELSEKYLRKHSRYFLFGHLQAADACTTNDDSLLEKTVQYTIETIRRGRVRDFAYTLVANNFEFFNRNELFREYVSSIPVRGEDHLLRLEQLLVAGVDPDLVTWNEERVSNITEGNYEKLQFHAIRWCAANHKVNSPYGLALLARALQNEKHKSDETSLLAATELIQLRTNDAHVNKSLLSTVKHDENVQIAYRAAIALIENGQAHKKAHALLHENQNNGQIPIALLAHGNRLLANLGPVDCGTEVASREPKNK